MLLANIVRQAQTPLEIYVIAPEHTGRGMAYGTSHPEHLLNVRAENMGAWADDREHFHAWLQQRGSKIGPHDFAPRGLYGDYLEEQLRNALREALQKEIL